MEITDYLSIISQALLIIALPVVIAAAVQTLRVQTQKLKDNLGEDRFNALKSFVQTAVQVAEQSGILEQLTGPEKRARAIQYVQTYLTERNINIDVEKISELVEAEVLSQFNTPSESTETGTETTGTTQQSLIDGAIEAAVLAAEQNGIQGNIGNDSATKKAYALQMVREYLSRYGITLSDELVSGLIEAQILRFRLAASGQLPTSGSTSQPVG